MINFLQVGQRFTCERFVREAVCRIDGLEVNLKRLYMSDEGPLPDQPELGATCWTVIHTMMTGGGMGHGPGDVYPDGWQVIAEDPRGRRIRFYQSGCFTGLVPPADVVLVQGQDAPASEPQPLW